MCRKVPLFSSSTKPSNYINENTKLTMRICCIETHKHSGFPSKKMNWGRSQKTGRLAAPREGLSGLFTYSLESITRIQAVESHPGKRPSEVFSSIFNRIRDTSQLGAKLQTVAFRPFTRYNESSLSMGNVVIRGPTVR